MAKRAKHTRDEIIESAKSFAELLTQKRPARAIGKHLKELLHITVWQVTQADGKYGVRYWSEGYRSEQNRKNCQHEHVIEKKKLVEKMLSEPNNIREILDTALACLVTKQEHKILNNLSKSHTHLDGWERYKHAGIKVYDIQEKKFLW